MSFKELENKIANFIDYYNNVRIQEKLNRMAPSKYRNTFYNKKNIKFNSCTNIAFMFIFYYQNIYKNY
ncbi:IS3 family transposase [bacterium]|nr:IS3 family transposase [bacterium]